MTQSGQGQEPHHPAARPAHEGVVLPAEGGETWSAQGAGPAGGRPWDGQWGPQEEQQYPQPQQPGGYSPQQPPQQGGYPQQPPQYGGHSPQQPPHGQGAYPQHQAAPQPGPYQQQPPQPGPYQQQPSQPGPYQQQPSQSGPYQQQYGAPAAQPLPPEAPRGAADEDATRYLPPVAPGAGPLPAEHPAESTQYLGTRPAAASDADATQYIPPVAAQQGYGIRPGTPDERQPPAEFDSLFRAESGGATQHLPRYADPAPSPPRPEQPEYEQQPARRSSKLPLIAAVVVGCAVVGLGAGALLSAGGGEDTDAKSENTSVAAASSPAPDASTQTAADPARTQAEALDRLLAESNNSRDAVIRSVESIKACQNLDQAAADLRGAAAQRRGLVTKLQGLSVDKLPDNSALSAALTRAWQASASADDHYAVWATQVKGKKGCKDGHARNTGHTAQANRASGEATAAKQQAAGLWNRIATTYGLTPRQPTQL
ncbi:hypothetical protein ACLGI4_16830 [Streptomyces sp. HMX112]|uniref:hypothetical protein n=1 Tax=Streptomyces sp. HMX112 TaxID=3390850 RepID=UPI003A81163F